MLLRNLRATASGLIVAFVLPFFFTLHPAWASLSRFPNAQNALPPRVAVVIGIDDYQSKELAPLDYAVEDAKAIAALLRDQGTPKSDTTLLTSEESGDHYASRDNILRALKMATQHLKQKSPEGKGQLIFFFSGHGVRVGDKLSESSTLLAREGVLMAADAETQKRRGQITYAELEKWLAANRGDSALVMLDTHTDAKQGARLLSGAARGFENALILGACQRDQIASEMPKFSHGVLTQYLLEGWDSAADANGLVHGAALAESVRRSMADWSAEHLKRPQTPVVYEMSARGTAFFVVGRRSSEPIQILLNVDKGPDATYQFGEKVTVSAKVDRDCFLTIYNVDSQGEVSQIFPNQFTSSNRVRAEQTVLLPNPSDKWEIEVGGNPGRETVIAVASATLLPLPHSANGAIGTVGPYEGFSKDLGRALGQDWQEIAPLVDKSASLALVRFLTIKN